MWIRVWISMVLYTLGFYAFLSTIMWYMKISWSMYTLVVTCWTYILICGLEYDRLWANINVRIMMNMCGNYDVKSYDSSLETNELLCWAFVLKVLDLGLRAKVGRSMNRHENNDWCAPNSTKWIKWMTWGHEIKSMVTGISQYKLLLLKLWLLGHMVAPWVHEILGENLLNMMQCDIEWMSC